MNNLGVKTGAPGAPWAGADGPQGPGPRGPPRGGINMDPAQPEPPNNPPVYIKMYIYT